MLTFFKKYFFAIILATFLIVPAVSYAALPSLVPECATNSAKYPGGCNICDAIEVGINVTKILLGTLGSAALLVFVYGGFLMLYSRGHTDQVQKGKEALISAAKGVIVVLGSWVVINYGLAVMLDKNISGPVKIFDGSWSKVMCTPSPSQTIISTSNSSTSLTVDCKNVGDSCGDGYICDKQLDCVQTCEKRFGNSGYSCINKNSSSSPSTCMTGYCPGQASDIQCCKK